MNVRTRTMWGLGPATAIAVLVMTAGSVWAQPGASLSDSLRKHVESKSTAPVDVIVEGREVAAIAARLGLRVKKLSTEWGVLEATGAQIEALGAEVGHLSRDVEVRSFMAVTNEATGADQVWAGVAGMPGLTGKGIGIALIDSGVWTGHRSLAGRVAYAKDFVGDGLSVLSREDPFGHGTHIGAIIAGNSPYPADSTRQTPFRGVAPGANLISLRVIGPDGSGRASSVIEAILWAIENRNRYNIRVINLSLGAPVEESYKTDPLCKAVERAVQAGIVVVVAAGNRGKDAEGRSVYGGIESPGNDPCDYGSGAEHHGYRRAVRRRAGDVQLEGTDGDRRNHQAGHRGAWEQDCVGRGGGRVAGCGLPCAARVGRGRRRLHDVERNEHVDGRGGRHGGADARGER